MASMYHIGVMPVSRGTTLGMLSYFSGVEYPVGSFVQVPVRGKENTALVVSSEKVKDVKTALRKSGFSLQKIRRQQAHRLVTKEFMQAVEHTARYHAITPGAVLHATMPKSFLEMGEVLAGDATASRPMLRGYIVPRLYQALSKVRIEFYRTSIRESFAAKGSVFIVTPTIADAQRVHTELSKGIERYTYLLHSKLTKNEQKKRIVELLSNKHPVCIIASYHFLSLPRHDLATIIIERENSSLFRTRNRPYFDVRTLAHELATQLGGQLFLADLPLRIESVYRRELGEYEEIVTGHHRMHFKTRAELCNMQGVVSQAKKPFRVLSHSLLERMQDKEKNGGRTFLYVARRGLSPITVCRDCGTVVMCNECGASVVLHKGSEENYFLCHSCGALRHARERCKKCRSWRLEAFGIGTELAEREVRKAFPVRDVLVLSSDTAKTHTAAAKVVADFYSKPGSILIGTEMALPYLIKHIPLVGIVSLDSLLSLASWNIYERVASTLTRLREVAGEDLFLQTRRPEAKILHTILSGNFTKFYRNELKVRKELGYPPFTVIIKVTVTGKQSVVTEKMKEAVALLVPFELVAFSRMLRAPKGNYSLHGFIRVAREDWPNEELYAKLLSLPPSFAVSVDPDSIL